MKAVIFDLDDTLIPDTEAIAASFALVGAKARAWFNVNPNRLVEATRRRARESWFAAPTYDYARRVGISSWEALSSDFPGPENDSDLHFLRGWAKDYRKEAWHLGLLDNYVDDPEGAGQLAEEYRDARRRLHKPYDDAIETLVALRDLGLSVALITNGPADLQRQKLQRTGLIEFIDPIVISSEVGHGKPEPRIFEIALEALSVEPHDAVMVGDNPQRDIEGALGAGMDAVWVRHGREATLVPATVPSIEALAELPQVIATMQGRG